MKGILYKEYGIWLVEYVEQRNGKSVKKSIPLHSEDLIDMTDDGYAINYDFVDVEFDILIFNNKVVAKMIKKELPHIKIEKEDD